MKSLIAILLTLFSATAFASYHVPDNSVTASKLQTHIAGQITNCGFATSVATNALTITLNDGDGNTATAASPCKIDFRSPTATTGTQIKRTISSALSLLVPNGATLGCSSGAACTLYVYLIDTGSGVVLGVNSFNQADEAVVQNSVLVTVGSNSIATIYSAAAQTAKAIRNLGRITITEATAGTWATNATALALWPASKLQTISTSQQFPLRIESFLVAANGVVTEPGGGEVISGNCTTSGINGSTYTCNFDGGLWIGNPICTGTSHGGPLNDVQLITTTSPSTLIFATAASGINAQAATDWICIGPR